MATTSSDLLFVVCLIFYCTQSNKRQQHNSCGYIACWSIAATVSLSCPVIKRFSRRITRVEYLNGPINPCGPKGGINNSKPRHDRPLAESSLDGTGSNYLWLNRTGRLLDYLLCRRRTTPGQLSLLPPPPPRFFWHLLVLFYFILSAHRLIKGMLARRYTRKTNCFSFPFSVTLYIKVLVICVH